MELIEKDALVAEIDNRIKITAYPNYGAQRIWAYNDVKEIIDTLEVKEVDLKKEIDEYISNNFFGSQTLGFFANRTKEEPNYVDIALCAKHFFKLGLKAQKGESV